MVRTWFFVSTAALAGIGCHAVDPHEPTALADRVTGSSGTALVDGPIDIDGRREIGPRPMVSVDTGDINGDGREDIVIFGNRIKAWVESPADPSAGPWPRHDLSVPVERWFKGSAQAADIDADGDIDIVVSMDNHSGAERSAYVYLLRNPGGNATGTWTPVTLMANEPLHHINDMAVADMDGDGRLDVVMRSLEPNQLHILFQNTPTSWSRRSIDATPFGADGEGMAVGNIDGIGHPDITISGYWLHAPTDPRQEPYVSHVIDTEVGLSPSDFNHNTKEDIGDVDGDGDLDVVISPAEGYRGGDNYDLAVYLNPGSPRTAHGWPRRVLASNFNGGHFVRFGDMDSDGDLDVVSGIAWSQWGQTSAIRIYYNLGYGYFGQPQTVASGRGLYAGNVVDIEGDGDLDIVGASTYQGTLDFYRSSEGGTVVPTPDAGTVTYDAGATPADAGNAPPDAGNAPPDAGNAPPDAGNAPPDAGVAPPDAGMTLDAGDVPPCPPYERIEAESYDGMMGVGIYPGGTGQKVGSVHNGEWIRFDAVDFCAPVGGLSASVAALADQNGRIEFRLDSTSGPLIAEVSVPTTGNWNSFVDVGADVAAVTGVHDLYLVFRGDSGFLLDVDYFQFEASAPQYDAGVASPSDGGAAADASSSGLPDAGSDAQLDAGGPPGCTSSGRVEAELYDAMTGIGIYPGGTGQKVGSVHNGEWIRFDAFEFCPGAKDLRASVSALWSHGGRVEFRLDAPTGPLLAEILVPTTNNWNTFVDVDTSFVSPAGGHDLYLVFRGGSGFLLDIDYFVISDI